MVQGKVFKSLFKMGSTITYSIRSSWRNDLISTLTNFRKFLNKNSVKSISITDLKNKFDLTEDMITFFDSINAITNIAKKKGGKKAKKGTYSLSDISHKILSIFENESDNQLSLFLHKLLLDNYFQYQFFINFFKEIYLKTTEDINNIKLAKNKIRNNFLDYNDKRYGTSEFIDKQTFLNIFNFVLGVNLLVERNDKKFRLNPNFFNEIDYKKLNISIERHIKSYPEGLLTRKLCEMLKKIQNQFYYGKDLTLTEIYELIVSIYLEKIENVVPNFEFSGGLPYPPVPSPHTVIKYKLS